MPVVSQYKEIDLSKNRINRLTDCERELFLLSEEVKKFSGIELVKSIKAGNHFETVLSLLPHIKKKVSEEFGQTSNAEYARNVIRVFYKVIGLQQRKESCNVTPVVTDDYLYTLVYRQVEQSIRHIKNSFYKIEKSKTPLEILEKRTPSVLSDFSFEEREEAKILNTEIPKLVFNILSRNRYFERNDLHKVVLLLRTGFSKPTSLENGLRRTESKDESINYFCGRVDKLVSTGQLAIESVIPSQTTVGLIVGRKRSAVGLIESTGKKIISKEISRKIFTSLR